MYHKDTISYFTVHSQGKTGFSVYLKNEIPQPSPDHSQNFSTLMNE